CDGRLRSIARIAASSPILLPKLDGSPPHGPAAAASLRLHRTLPAVEGGAATFRPALGSRNQARWPSVEGAAGRLTRPLLCAQRSRPGGALCGCYQGLSATLFKCDPCSQS